MVTYVLGYFRISGIGLNEPFLKHSLHRRNLVDSFSLFNMLHSIACTKLLFRLIHFTLPFVSLLLQHGSFQEFDLQMRWLQFEPARGSVLCQATATDNFKTQMPRVCCLNALPTCKKSLRMRLLQKRFTSAFIPSQLFWQISQRRCRDCATSASSRSAQTRTSRVRSFDLGSMDKVCDQCGAKLFQCEQPGFCCSLGGCRTD